MPRLVYGRAWIVSEAPIAVARLVFESSGGRTRDALNDEHVLWIEQHHERFDGAGYPSGLAGAQISEGAQLLALADT